MIESRGGGVGGEVEKKKKKGASEQGSEEECKKCKECTIIHATQRVDPFCTKDFWNP